MLDHRFGQIAMLALKFLADHFLWSNPALFIPIAICHPVAQAFRPEALLFVVLATRH
jgi:hypothetical protein